ncbi:hypothetical protein J3R74_000205 [Puniceicoccus vermicola]
MDGRHLSSDTRERAGSSHYFRQNRPQERRDGGS